MIMIGSSTGRDILRADLWGIRCGWGWAAICGVGCGLRWLDVCIEWMDIEKKCHFIHVRE